MSKKTRCLDFCDFVGNAMLLLIERTGRKVLNSEQIEAYIYNVTRNLSNYKLIDMDIKFLDYNYRTMFYVVQTEDN